MRPKSRPVLAGTVRYGLTKCQGTREILTGLLYQDPFPYNYMYIFKGWPGEYRLLY